ncbi:MAG: YibE/F family protein [Actinomycetota bacterium]
MSETPRDADAHRHAHGHAHGHSHAHSHADDIPWTAFRSEPLLQGVLVFIGLALLATLVSIGLLWPTGEGRDDAVARGEQVGLGSERFAATVTAVSDGLCSYATSDSPQTCRTIEFRVDEGEFVGLVEEFQEFNLRNDALTPNVSVGDSVIAGFEPSTGFWFYADLDRRGSLVVLVALFAIFVIALGRLRGALALLGMVATVAVLIFFVAPSVLDGNDPLLVAVVAASAIAFVSLYLTHGVNPTTTVALAGTLLSLGLTLALASAFFALARFTGLATEESQLLPFVAGSVDLSALLLGGAVLGTLGALDDVTVTQVATVSELHRRSPNLSVSQLVVSGIRVGREHIASTVNTLLLAYVGASMPLLLLFAASDQALDKVANSELISVEIVRTLCGSIGLVAAVPVTTVLAALVTRRAITDEIELRDPDDDDAVTVVVEEPPEHEDEIAAPSWDDFAPRELGDEW